MFEPMQSVVGRICAIACLPRRAATCPGTLQHPCRPLAARVATRHTDTPICGNFGQQIELFPMRATFRQVEEGRQ